MEANERLPALAEGSGNLKRLIGWVNSRWVGTHIAGDLPAARALADQLLELALREGGRTSLAIAHTAQIQTRVSRGDLAGAEKLFHSGR